MILEGKPVLLRQPDFATLPKFTGTREMNISAYGESSRLAQFSGAWPMHGFAHTHVLQNKAEIESLADFFDEVRGRWGNFWVPSWHAELNPVADIPNGGDQLSITPCDYEEIFFQDSDVRRLGNYVFLLRMDGTLHLSKVTAVETASPEVLTLETPVESMFTLGTFFVGFLYHVRFTIDRLDIQCTSPSYATAKLQMIENVFVKLISSTGGGSTGEPITPGDRIASDKDDSSFTDSSGNVFTL